jgi:hypothetical protein
MPSEKSQPDRRMRPSPEEQTAEWRQEMGDDWPAFVAGIVRSREQLAAWRAAGNPGWPPGWMSLRDYLREHPL